MLKKTKTNIALAARITWWLVKTIVLWFVSALPKTKKDISYFINLLVLNYFLINTVFLPHVTVLAKDIMPWPQVVRETVEVVKEVEMEPTNPDVWVAWRIAKAGLNPLEAAVVQVNESGYRNNDNRYNINTNSSADLGRWQWNTQHIDSGLISIECAGNYKCSTEKAIEARLKDGSWSVKWYGARAAGL